MTSTMDLYARLSLSFLWVFTGLTSVIFAKSTGYEVLAGVGVTGIKADISIYAGSALDIFIGIWLLLGWKQKSCYLVQIAIIAVYTILLTVMAPEFWLHPFGPVTKNIPIVVLILILYKNQLFPYNQDAR